MKNSNIAWIGQIPDNWKLERLQWHLDEIKESNDPVQTKQVLSLTNKLGVIPYEQKGEQGNKAKEDVTDYKLAYPNTIVANSMNVLIGSVGKCNYFGCVSPVYYVFKPKEKENIDFINYIFQTEQFQKELRRFANGILEIRLRVSSGDILKREIAFPSFEQQQKIVNFLNKKCSEIDKLIELENKQIENLKEYKQSVITEAVTKGLDKNAKMKDSGVEWIGEIPSNWSTQKVLYQLEMPVTDGPHTTPELLSEGVAFVSAEAVSCGNGTIDFSHIRGYISEEFYKECCLKYIPAIDDVYMIKSGATTGKVSIVTALEPRFTIWSPIAVMRCDKTKMLSKFLYYALQSTHFQRQVSLGWSFGTQQNLGMRTLEQLKLVVPKLDEQKLIVEFLNKKSLQIDSLIEIKNKKIEELQQYKKSIIYEYVTGKKEVQ